MRSVPLGGPVNNNNNNRRLVTLVGGVGGDYLPVVTNQPPGHVTMSSSSMMGSPHTPRLGVKRCWRNNIDQWRLTPKIQRACDEHATFKAYGFCPYSFLCCAVCLCVVGTVSSSPPLWPVAACTSATALCCRVSTTWPRMAPLSSSWSDSLLLPLLPAPNSQPSEASTRNPGPAGRSHMHGVACGHAGLLGLLLRMVTKGN